MKIILINCIKTILEILIPRFGFKKFNPNNLINHYVGINDEIIRNFIENKELIEVLNLLFNNNIYLRNDPLLQVLSTSEKMTNGNFHTDRYMQFSLMLLLEDAFGASNSYGILHEIP